MTKKFWQNKQFKELQKEWYDKAKNKGFSDIETTKPGMQNTLFLKDHSKRMARRYSSDVEEHFRRCRIHLHEHKFKSEFDRQLFKWYTEGESYRSIIRLIKEKYDRKRSIFYVFTHVKRLRKDMESMKLWLEE